VRVISEVVKVERLSEDNKIKLSWLG